MKEVKKHLEFNKSSPEEIKKWEADAGKYAKKIIDKKIFPNWEFFTGETPGAEGGM